MTLEGGEGQQVVDLIEVSLSQVGDRYEKTYTGFDVAGKYTLFFYVKDSTGIISPFATEYVYKGIEGNQPPGSFDLLSPGDGASTNTSAGLMFAWAAAIDPNGDPVTYTLTVFDAQGALLYKRKGITVNYFAVGPDTNFVNGQSYSWQVTGVDQYGMSSLGATGGFTVSSGTPVKGWIKGHVYDSATDDAISNAVVKVNDMETSFLPSGDYLGILPAGTYVVTAEASGYIPAGYYPVIINEGDITTRNIELAPVEDEIDSDGDGYPDDSDAFPDDPNEWLDTDGDGIGNNADPDDDNDGMTDEWEEKYGLNPLIDDADEDPDNDGLTNLEEYQNNINPTEGDTDGDDMPDGWEVTYGLNPLENDANEDLDGDDYSNLQEYLSGTEPNDINSVPQPPITDAGPDQIVDENEAVTLDGSNSTDLDDGIFSYLWEQTGGTTGVTLSDPTAVQPIFVAPEVGENGESLTFKLTVTDNGGLHSIDTCIVTVIDTDGTDVNNPPTAEAGPNKTVYVPPTCGSRQVEFL
jgi:hypothetical protein